MIYFMQICNTGVLLVSNGKISCDLILRALMTRTNKREIDTHMN